MTAPAPAGSAPDVHPVLGAIDATLSPLPLRPSGAVAWLDLGRAAFATLAMSGVFYSALELVNSYGHTIDSPGWSTVICATCTFAKLVLSAYVKGNTPVAPSASVKP